MEMSRFLVLTLILTSEITAREMKNGFCHDNICDVMTKLSEDNYKREEFETNLEIFAIENNLESGHEALKEELETMGHIFNIGKDKPLQAYLMRLQRIIQEETYNNTEQLLEEKVAYIYQEFRDLHHSIKRKSDEQNKNTAAISIELGTNGRRLDAIQVNFEKKIEDQENKSSALFDVLKLMTAKLDDIQSNLCKFHQEIQNETNKVDAVEETVATTPEPQTNQKRVDGDNSNQAGAQDEQNLKQFLEEFPTTSPTLRPLDCSDLLTTGAKNSGVYTIYPLSLGIKVYCDMESNGGGWTVFVNRLEQTTAENFNRPWEQYKQGFGNASNEYWMGNEALYAMTNSRDYTLRVDASIVSEGRTTWGEWAHFKIQSEDNKYKLSVSGYETSSSMRDFSMTNHHGSYFSTPDRDNDVHGVTNCAAYYGGGYWFDNCGLINPTGSYSQMFLNPWSVMDSTRYRIASHLQMKIRPK